MTDFPRIVFFGTPDFAVGSLESLIKSGYSVIAVVTAPDKPSGRGLKIKSPPVKDFAAIHGIPVLQPVSLKDPLFIENLAGLKPDLQVVVAFRLMPKAVWSIAPLGTFNLHASLLPQYRGAAPINHAIINGETETGVTTFFLEENMDTGNILFREAIPIFPEETAGELHDRLMETGARLVVHTVAAITRKEISPVSQAAFITAGEPLKTAPKIHPEDCRVNWNNKVSAVFNFIRGLSPSPGAYSELPAKDGKTIHVKILKAIPEPGNPRVSPGFVVTDGREFLKIACSDGLISLKQLQVPGKKTVESRDFLSGYGRLFL